jgi:hypothetical protein
MSTNFPIDKYQSLLIFGRCTGRGGSLSLHGRPACVEPELSRNCGATGIANGLRKKSYLDLCSGPWSPGGRQPGVDNEWSSLFLAVLWKYS